jgi:2-methylcitrate dehydratase PrpD
VLNPVIDACLMAKANGTIDIERIDGITVTGGPLLKARADRPAVRAGREAQVSAQHAVAACLLFGRAGVAEFSDEAVSAPAVLALRAKVRPVAVDIAMPVESARVEFDMRGGEKHTVFIEDATGSAKKPLSRHDLERKFRGLAAYGCPGLDPEPLIGRLWSIEAAADVSNIMTVAGATKAGAK